MKTTYILLAFMAYACAVPAQKIELEYRNTDPAIYFYAGDFHGYNGALYMSCGENHQRTVGSFDVSTKEFKSYDHVYEAKKVQGFVPLYSELYFAGGDFYDRHLYSIYTNADPVIVPEVSHIDSVNYLAAYNNKLFFAGRANSQRTGIWCYDPVTHDLSAITLPATLYDPRHLITAGGLLYFVGRSLQTSYLWSYDDATGQVKKVSGISPQDGINFCADYNTTSTTNAPSRTMVTFDSTLFFTAKEEFPDYDHLSYVDRPTQQIKFVSSPPGGPDFLTELNGKLYRTYNSPGGFILYWYDAKTSMSDSLLMPAKNQVYPRISYLTAYNGRLFFNQVGPENGIFAFDPVTETVSKITDTLYNPQHSVRSNYMYVYNNKLYFSAKSNNSKYGLDIWSYYEHPTEIKQISKTETPNIYPNPCKEDFSIELPLAIADKNISIGLFNASGQLIRQEKLVLNTKINIAYLHPGVYFYRISNGNTSWLGKLVKE